MANRKVSIPYDVWECLRVRFCDYGRQSVDKYVTGVLLNEIRRQLYVNECSNIDLKTVLENHGIKPLGEK